MGLFDSRVKKSGQKIREYLSSYDCPLSGLRFSVTQERDYCAFTCDELRGVFLNGFGGDYESSIAIYFSEGRGLTAEVYISNAKARGIGSSLQRVVNDAIWEYTHSSLTDTPMSANFTPYSPGDTSMTFEVCAHNYKDPMEFDASLARICLIIKSVAEHFA